MSSAAGTARGRSRHGPLEGASRSASVFSSLAGRCRLGRVAPGTAFGNFGDHFVRISLATEKALLLEGVRRLCEFVKSC